MKNKSYKFGPNSFKAYQKKVGKSYEIGIISKGRPIFLGNFVMAKEANAFWSLMNKQIAGFGKKYKLSTKNPPAWYSTFLANHVSGHYYNFVTKQIPRHHREANKVFKGQKRKWEQHKKKAGSTAKHFLKAA